jgi:hypothetical protein
MMMGRGTTRRVLMRAKPYKHKREGTKGEEGHAHSSMKNTVYCWAKQGHPVSTASIPDGQKR